MDICAFVLHSTPDVLSLGGHCAQHGFEFQWKVWATSPTWTKPNGEVITLPTENFVPYLEEDAPASTTKMVHRGPSADTSYQQGPSARTRLGTGRGAIATTTSY